MGMIGFVILNYKAYEEAAACAVSILKTQTYPDIQIVIVDNGSGNDSVEQLKARFCGEERVHIIAAEKNLGFAQGNNLGIAYAREHFAPDFVVAANSDIIFEQPDYCQKLFEIYRRKPFAVLGGDIIDESRTQHFNPVARARVYTIPYLRKQALVSQLKVWMFRAIKVLGGDIIDESRTQHFNPVARARVYTIPYLRKQALVSQLKVWMFRAIKLFHLKKAVAGRYGVAANEAGADVCGGAKNLTTREVEGRSVAADSRIDEELYDVLLHGCCLVFSVDFFAELDGFWQETFLYAEEEILYYLAKKKGLRLLYTPEVTCMHKEAVTTKQLYQDVCDAKIFYFSNVARSYRKFLKLMREYESPEVTCMHKEAVTTKQLYQDVCDAKIFYFSNVARSYRKFLKLMREYE